MGSAERLDRNGEESFAPDSPFALNPLECMNNNRLVFFNIGWMKYYQGLPPVDDIEDAIANGGSYTKETRFGHELYNFKPYYGSMYGFVESKSLNDRRNSIAIEKIDPLAKGQDKIKDVTVVWIATRPRSKDNKTQFGTYIVGWYKNATVYRVPQEDIDRYYTLEQKGKEPRIETVGYFAEAKAEDCTLLPIDERIIEVGRGKDWVGQSNIWYASSDNPEVQAFREKVIQYIEGEKPTIKPKAKKVALNSERRTEVEQAAVKHITNYYQSLGYSVTSREAEKIGWDLDVKKDDLYLRVEVKGRGFETDEALISKNEYTIMKTDKDGYRLVIVTDALSDPTGFIFSYDPVNDCWSDDDGNVLEFEEMVSAKVRIKREPVITDSLITELPTTNYLD